MMVKVLPSFILHLKQRTSERSTQGENRNGGWMHFLLHQPRQHRHHFLSQFFVQNVSHVFNTLVAREARICRWAHGFPGATCGKEPACKCRKTWDVSLILGLRRSPGGGPSNPLHYSCLDNSMDRGACWATVHGVTKSRDTTEWLTLSLSHMDCLVNTTISATVTICSFRRHCIVIETGSRTKYRVPN